MKLNYFYWDQCRYCHQFNPIWNKLKLYLRDDIHVREYERNQAGFENVASKNNVQFFPTLTLQTNNSIHEVKLDDYKNRYNSSSPDYNDKVAKDIYNDIVHKQQTGGSRVNYQEKYLKYKEKYLQLKNKF